MVRTAFYSQPNGCSKGHAEVSATMSAALGYGESEIFPKQIKLHLDRGDVGNFLNLPYYDHENGLRYAILDDGTSANLEEFIDLYENMHKPRKKSLSYKIVDSGETDL